MLQKETVKPATLGLLINLMNPKKLKQFRQVEGTALSLLLGYRSPINLNLFTSKSLYSAPIINKLSYINPAFSTFEKAALAGNISECIRITPLLELITKRK
jgi:hypothetical protein